MKNKAFTIIILFGLLLLVLNNSSVYASEKAKTNTINVVNSKNDINISTQSAHQNDSNEFEDDEDGGTRKIVASSL